MPKKQPRTLCLSCQRPEKACICQFTVAINNDIHVVVLQHPSEVSQTKGTIALLARSLRSCQVIVGENFSADTQLAQVFDAYQAILLYPSAQANTLNPRLIEQIQTQGQACDNNQVNSKPLCLIILDGTWKKAYRMFMLSENLQQLPQISLPDYLADAGQYLIRKVARKNALSSLEASCYALALLEAGSDFSSITPGQAGKYQPLLNKFNAFNQFQLSFRPKYTRST